MEKQQISGSNGGSEKPWEKAKHPLHQSWQNHLPSQERSKLFLGGLSTNTKAELVRQHFSAYGTVVDAVVMGSKARPRGFGFVTFLNEDDANAALAEQQTIDGRVVDVKRAVPEDSLPKLPKLFVGGLPQNIMDKDLRAYFKTYGPVSRVWIMLDKKTGRSQGFGFVEFKGGPLGEKAVQAALADYYNHGFGGKWVEVRIAESKEDRAARADFLNLHVGQEEEARTAHQLESWMTADQY